MLLLSDPLAVLEWHEATKRKLTNVSNLVAAGGYQTDSALGRAAETNQDLVYSPIPRFDKLSIATPLGLAGRSINRIVVRYLGTPLSKWEE